MSDAKFCALGGVRVLDLSRLLPGPYLSLILADLGADVVKVEDPGPGDYLRVIPPAANGMSRRFRALNRDKRSLILDLKSRPGVAAFLRLVEAADVVIESFRPGVMDRLGVGWEVLRQRNPKLVLCSVSGYGQTGAYRERAGHDINYVGTAGVLAMGGRSQPGLPGVQLGDLAGGAMWGAIGVLGALMTIRLGGEGRHLDISMTEGALALMCTELGDSGVEARGRGTLNGGLARYGIFETKDRGYLSVGSLEPKFWLAFNEAIGREPQPDDLTAPAGVQEALRADIAARLATKTRAEWKEVFDARDCCVDEVLEPGELSTHPLHRSRDVFTTTGELARLPVGTARREREPPSHGEHSREVLLEFGFTDAEIDSLSGGD